MTAPRNARAAAALLLVAVAAAASAERLTDAQRRGKRIYIWGKGRGKIVAFLAGPGISAPGKGFPRVNCHLAGGTGQSEGGVRSADIGWYNLTKEYAGRRPTGRSHPACTDDAFLAAVTEGVEPAGNALDPAHPRYKTTRQGLEDPIAYVKVMDREPEPGVTDDEAAKYLASGRVPVFVPLLAAPEGGYGADRYTFHAYASVRDPARVMVDFLAASLTAPANRWAGAAGAAFQKVDPGSRKLVPGTGWREPR